jgi:serine/threonine-protein kinase
MKDSNSESCQTCFRPAAVDGAQQQTQWISVCRCDRPYSPNAAQISIDVCANCKLRVPIGVSGRVNCAGLCSCAQPNAKKIPTYIKQNESDAVALDLTAVGMSPENFPAEKYTPIAILGDGARAVTILARDRQRGTKVAVKCFKRIASTLKSTFESEVRKNKEFTYATIAKIVDCGFPAGTKAPYLVTEYKDGFNLEQCLAMHGTPSDDVAVKILISVCESVIYAQKQGVLHRDIRPGNIIFLDDMNSEPSVSILDFALPKIKMSEQLTEPVDALYMSADEARGLEYTEKSEVYSIGCVGYSLLTGSPPFREGTALDIKNMHGLKLPPKISSVKFDNKRPKDLEEIIERCLEKDPSYRFDSIPKLLERLEVFPRRVQMQIAAVLAARKRKKILLILAVVLAILIICALVYFVLRAH